MKQEWQYRYEHEKACRNAQCVVLDIEIPKDEIYGELNEVPGLHYRKFNGKVFFAHLEANGHSRAEYERCQCNKDNQFQIKKTS